LKTAAKAAGAAEGRSTQHYWALNIILLMLRATLVVEFQQPSQALTGVDLASGFTDPVRWRGKENHVVLPLVVSFGVVMAEVIVQATPQRSLSEQDHFRQHFGFDGPDPPFAVGIHIRTPRRQPHRLDSH
jgi:hypothetical protein